MRTTRSLEARKAGIPVHRIHFIRSRALFFWREEARNVSKKVAERFEDELGKIIKNNLRAIRRHSLNFIAKGAMHRAYKDACFHGMLKKHGVAACRKLAKKFHLHQRRQIMARYQSGYRHRANYGARFRHVGRSRCRSFR